MEFLEVLTEGLERVLLVRGGGREVITIYSWMAKDRYIDHCYCLLLYLVQVKKVACKDYAFCLCILCQPKNIIVHEKLFLH